MSQKNFHCSFAANVTPAEAFAAINKVTDWWTTHLTGSSKKLNDEFRVDFGTTFVTMKVTESIPDKKVAWRVLDCNIDFVKDKKEWKDTDMIFEIHPEGKGARVDMTHVGLTPEVECYDDCRVGWTFFVTRSLQSLLTTGKGQADAPRAMQESVVHL